MHLHCNLTHPDFKNDICVPAVVPVPASTSMNPIDLGIHCRNLLIKALNSHVLKV